MSGDSMCQMCEKPITGERSVLPNGFAHPACVACEDCGAVLHNGALRRALEHQERYGGSLRHRSEDYCATREARRRARARMLSASPAEMAGAPALLN